MQNLLEEPEKHKIANRARKAPCYHNHF